MQNIQNLLFNFMQLEEPKKYAGACSIQERQKEEQRNRKKMKFALSQHKNKNRVLHLSQIKNPVRWTSPDDGYLGMQLLLATLPGLVAGSPPRVLGEKVTVGRPLGRLFSSFSLPFCGGE
jgi:hypothetical protein